MDRDATLDTFLSAVAAKGPTPGGGAVAAVCGALSAAIGEMVLNYSIGRKATPHLDPQLRPHLESLTRARGLLLQLMVEDQEAYAAFTDAKKANADDAEIARLRQVCIAVPQAITATAIALLATADAVVEISNRYLLSDLAVCCELAMATARAGVHNVRANFADLDPNQRAQIDVECDAELARAVGLVQRTMPRIAVLMRQS